jgi:Na+/H+-translocating membrane pyrophosphatase
MNKAGLSAYIHELLSNETIEKLKQFDERGIIRQIITTMLTAMRCLPLKFAIPLSARLGNLAKGDEMSLQRIKEFLKDQKKSFLWDKYKALVIVIFTILICLLIYFTSK